MNTPFEFKGLNSTQIYKELLKCPKSKWIEIIGGLPSGIKSELVALLSNKNKKDSTGASSTNNDSIESTSNKLEVEDDKAGGTCNKRIKLESHDVSEPPSSSSSCTFYETASKAFGELKISTYSPLGSIISKTMYIAGDLRTALKESNMDETSVRLIQIYLNIWITLLWNSLFNNNNKKSSSKLSNNLIKKHLGGCYRHEVNKFEHDSMLNKTVHKQVGINQSINSESCAFLSSEGSNIVEASDDVAVNEIENDREKTKSSTISMSSANTDKRFEYRLKLRDVRTRKMPPESYKEFAILREKIFRSSLNVIHEWLSITWSTYYNNGLKDTKISQIPSNSLQLFSFLINDLISSLVEDALKISYLESNNGATINVIDNINSLGSHSNKIKEEMDNLNPNNLDFEIIIDCFTKNDDFTSVPKLSHMHYLYAIVNRIMRMDYLLFSYLCKDQVVNINKPSIDLNTVIDTISLLHSKLTNQIVRGESNCINSIHDNNIEAFELDKQDDNTYLSSIGTGEEDDMFEAIIESATEEYSINSAFPYGIPDEISIFCYLRLKKVIKNSKDPEDFNTIFNQLIKEWNRDTTNSEDENGIEIQKTKESSKYFNSVLNKYINVAYKVIAFSNLMKSFIK